MKKINRCLIICCKLCRTILIYINLTYLPKIAWISKIAGFVNPIQFDHLCYLLHDIQYCWHVNMDLCNTLVLQLYHFVSFAKVFGLFSAKDDGKMCKSPSFSSHVVCGPVTCTLINIDSLNWSQLICKIVINIGCSTIDAQ